MENNTLQENKMGTMPIGKLLLSMALPMAASMLVQALYNIVDSIYVSRLSESALSAVSLAFPVQNIMVALGCGTAVGLNATVSRSLGAKRPDEADRFAGAGLFIGFAAMLLTVAFGLFFSRSYFAWQTRDAEIIAHGRDYLFWITVVSFGNYAQVLGERLLCSTGKTLYSMVSQITGAVINIILDPILIFGKFGLPAMGTAGAAIATVIGQIIASCIAFGFNLTVNRELHLRIRYIFRPHMRFIKDILVISIPSMIMLMVSSVMNFGMNQILLSFTSTAVAVFGVYYKLQSFVFMPVFGLNNAMVPIISYNYGAARRSRIMQTIKLAVLYACCLMAVGLLLFMTIPNVLLSFYNASETMQAIGQPALRLTSIAFLFAGYCIVLGSVFQALGNGVYSLVCSVVRQIVVLLPVAYLLSLSGNLNLVWLAFPIAEIASVSVSTFLFRKLYKSKIAGIPE